MRRLKALKWSEKNKSQPSLTFYWPNCSMQDNFPVSTMQESQFFNHRFSFRLDAVHCEIHRGRGARKFSISAEMQHTSVSIVSSRIEHFKILTFLPRNNLKLFLYLIFVDFLTLYVNRIRTRIVRVALDDTDHK